MTQLQMTSQPRITVIGSLNMDLVTVTSNVPNAGETVHGERFATTCGGKGANQAVACARLGAQVTMIGCVGDDAFGTMMVNNLRNEGINTEGIRIIPNQTSGIAAITIADGDNRIIIVAGANEEVTPAYILEYESIIAQSDLVLIQLEIPQEAVEKAVAIANQHQVPIMLNPAPAIHLDESFLAQLSWITPNEHELDIVTGSQPNSNPDDMHWQAKLSKSPTRIIMTKGADGAYWADESGHIHHSAGFKVTVVDTTGAGDTFNSALAVALAEQRSLQDAVQWATAAGAMSVTKFGAQAGMPSREQLNNWILQCSTKKC
ncbi:ribokinase [Paenibacillus sp. SC116]|uniref:ribokinase n=1 Tax=Paenibacillus sp. SC116 TaxID=2968986 RepID=UPI00215B478B|nr:ribokinase [Paenibacillus sp. SC116]MCR8843232.1 ribokinase [Paenibacillus sp. SC116]